MTEIKRKQLHYRVAEFFAPPGRTLQQMLEEALRKLNKIKDRKEAITESNSGDDWQRFINTHRSGMGMEFGTLVMLAPGQNKLLIATDDEKEEAELSHIFPPNDKEFLESIFYYGIKDNHILMIQSLSLRAKEFELYINWLLRTAGEIDNDNVVYINNFAPKEIYEKIESNPIKSVRVGSPLCEDIVIDKENKTEFDTKKLSVRRKGIGLDILRFFSPHQIDEIANDLGDTSNIEVFVEVTYKRQTDDDSQKVLNRITSALRHTSEEDIKIELKNGVTINGSQIKIKTFKSISAVGNQLDLGATFMEMRTWLEELLTKNMIDA